MPRRSSRKRLPTERAAALEGLIPKRRRGDDQSSHTAQTGSESETPALLCGGCSTELPSGTYGHTCHNPTCGSAVHTFVMSQVLNQDRSENFCEAVFISQGEDGYMWCNDECFQSDSSAPTGSQPVHTYDPPEQLHTRAASSDESLGEHPFPSTEEDSSLQRHEAEKPNLPISTSPFPGSAEAAIPDAARIQPGRPAPETSPQSSSSPHPRPRPPSSVGTAGKDGSSSIAWVGDHGEERRLLLIDVYRNVQGVLLCLVSIWPLKLGFVTVGFLPRFAFCQLVWSPLILCSFPESDPANSKANQKSMPRGAWQKVAQKFAEECLKRNIGGTWCDVPAMLRERLRAQWDHLKACYSAWYQVEGILQTPSGSRAKRPDETWQVCKDRVLAERQELAAREDQDYAFPVDVSDKLDKYVRMADEISPQIYEKIDAICGSDMATGRRWAHRMALTSKTRLPLECHATHPLHVGFICEQENT